MADIADISLRKWHALYTKPRWEKKIYAALIKKNLEAWCPLQKIVRQWSDRKKVVEEPLFKSYVFVYISDVEKTKVLQTDGVLNFVYYLGKPAIIKDAEIDAIKAYMDNVEATITLTTNDQLSKDMRVKIEKGVFMNNTGTVIRINKKTVLVNLESLGQVMLIEFPVGHVAIA